MFLQKVSFVILICHGSQLLELAALAQLCERILVRCRVVQVDIRMQRLAIIRNCLTAAQQVVE